MLQLQATFVILEHAPVDAVGFNAGLSSSTARSCKVCWQGLGTAPSPAPPPPGGYLKQQCNHLAQEGER